MTTGMEEHQELKQVTLPEGWKIPDGKAFGDYFNPRLEANRANLNGWPTTTHDRTGSRLNKFSYGRCCRLQVPERAPFIPDYCRPKVPEQVPNNKVRDLAADSGTGTVPSENQEAISLETQHQRRQAKMKKRRRSPEEEDRDQASQQLRRPTMEEEPPVKEDPAKSIAEVPLATVPVGSGDSKKRSPEILPESPKRTERTRD
jgi:hypothetical protein